MPAALYAFRPLQLGSFQPDEPFEQSTNRFVPRGGYDCLSAFGAGRLSVRAELRATACVVWTRA
jgi:hypothetical protein